MKDKGKVMVNNIITRLMKEKTTNENEMDLNKIQT